MFLIKYHDSIHLDGFSVHDVSRSFKAHRVEFHDDILYCFRSKFAYVALSHDQIDDIEDSDCPGAYIDIDDSFKAKEIAYCLPF